MISERSTGRFSEFEAETPHAIADAPGFDGPEAEIGTVETDDEDGDVTSELTAEQMLKEIARQKAKRLKTTAEKIQKARRVMTDKMLEIADLLAEAKDNLGRSGDAHQPAPAVSSAKLRAFAHVEAHIPRDEISTYVALAKTNTAERSALKGQGAGFAVLKALARDAGLREDVVDRMKANIPMDIAAVRRVRQARRLAAETQLQTLLRERRDLSNIENRTEQRAVVKAFETNMRGFVQELVAFRLAELSDDNYNIRTQELAKLAKIHLRELQAIVNTDEMPDDWRDLWNEYNAYSFEASQLALQKIAWGQFFVGEDGDYLETDDVNIDRWLIEAVARLVGIHASELGSVHLGTNRKSARSKGRAVVQKSPKLIEPPKSLRSVEICAGAGGQALGLHSAGFRARATFEVMDDAVETLRANFHTEVKRVFAENITQVDFKHYAGAIDLVAGGVPCQPYSTAGERKGEADERDLFRRAVEIVDEIKPRAFFFENVQGFSHSTNMSYRAELHAAFEAIGYQSRVFPIAGSDYGLAQGRPRIAFIGFRDPDAMLRFQMPPVFPQWQMTLADAIGDLVVANGWHGYEAWRAAADRKAPTIVGGSRKSDKLSFSSGLTMGTWKDLGIDSSYLAKSAPAPNHSGLFRLTLKIGARLQGFPDDWKFVGTDQQIKSQIGNALPPIMAKAVGLAIYAALENVEFDYELALRSKITAPAKPRTVLAETGSRLRNNFMRARHDRDQAILLEHMFFDEFDHDYDDGNGNGYNFGTIADPDRDRREESVIASALPLSFSQRRDSRSRNGFGYQNNAKLDTDI